MITEVFSFFKVASRAATSNDFFNGSGKYADGVLEIKGTASAFSVKVQGSVDNENSQWTDLCCINETDFTSGTVLTEKGIYDFNCGGKKIRVVIVSVSGGSLTITGKFIG